MHAPVDVSLVGANLRTILPWLLTAGCSYLAWRGWQGLDALRRGATAKRVKSLQVISKVNVGLSVVTLGTFVVTSASGLVAVAAVISGVVGFLGLKRTGL